MYRLVLLIALFVSLSFAALLPKNSDFPCRAYGNGTMIDITKAFNWPINITTPGNSKDGKYYYFWDCEGYRTPCGKGVTVCQQDVEQSFLMWPTGSSPQNALWQASSTGIADWLTINYFNGMRITSISFNVVKGSNSYRWYAKGDPEDGQMNYNFILDAPCINQNINISV